MAVITARGGSKRVPGKNIRDFRGKPLLAWTAEAAWESRYIDLRFVSTDSPEIIQVCVAVGIGAQHRPAELATDSAISEDVLRYHLKEWPHDWVVLLQPTSPLRIVEDIDACIERAQLGYGCFSTYMGKTNGAVYVASKDWIAEHDFHHLGLLKYEMPEERSLDIDEEADFDVVFPSDSPS